MVLDVVGVLLAGMLVVAAIAGVVSRTDIGAGIGQSVIQMQRVDARYWVGARQQQLDLRPRSEDVYRPVWSASSLPRWSTKPARHAQRSLPAQQPPSWEAAVSPLGHVVVAPGTGRDDF